MAEEKLNEDSKVLTDNDGTEIKKFIDREKLIMDAKLVFMDQGILVPPPVFSTSKKDIDNRILALKIALKNPDLHVELINEILSDLIVGAYQDRCDLYEKTMREHTDKGYKYLMKMRQSADNHLISILRAARDIKRPPVQVVVQRAEQVNVAEQMNQGDQQVNIAKNEHS